MVLLSALACLLEVSTACCAIWQTVCKSSYQFYIDSVSVTLQAVQGQPNQQCIPFSAQASRLQFERYCWRQSEQWRGVTHVRNRHGCILGHCCTEVGYGARVFQEP